MTAPTVIPAFAPEPRLESILSVGWPVGEDGRVLLLIVSAVAAEVVKADSEGKDVEVEVKNVELGPDEVEFDSTDVLGIVETKIEMFFNSSRGVAWKVSALGFEQSLSVVDVEQQAHRCEASS